MRSVLIRSKQEQSEGLQSLAGRISHVYKLYNRVAYNGDMKADVTDGKKFFSFSIGGPNFDPGQSWKL